MKFVFAVAAFLLGSISADTYTQKNHLKNQMENLITLVDKIDSADS